MSTPPWLQTIISDLSGPGILFCRLQRLELQRQYGGQTSSLTLFLDGLSCFRLFRTGRTRRCRIQKNPSMTITTQSSFTCFVFNVAGITFLVVAALVVGYLVVSWLREGSQGRRIIGQEIIWTLVPALVVVGLVIMSEISRGGEKGQGRLADGRVPASMR